MRSVFTTDAGNGDWRSAFCSALRCDVNLMTPLSWGKRVRWGKPTLRSTTLPNARRKSFSTGKNAGLCCRWASGDSRSFTKPDAPCVATVMRKWTKVLFRAAGICHSVALGLLGTDGCSRQGRAGPSLYGSRTSAYARLYRTYLSWNYGRGPVGEEN